MGNMIKKNNFRLNIIFILITFLFHGCSGSGGGDENTTQLQSNKSEALTKEFRTASGDKITITLPYGSLSQDKIQNDSQLILTNEDSQDCLKFKIEPDIFLNLPSTLKIELAQGDIFSKETGLIAIIIEGKEVFLKKIQTEAGYSCEISRLGTFTFKERNENELKLFLEHDFSSETIQSWQNTRELILSYLSVSGLYQSDSIDSSEKEAIEKTCVDKMISTGKKCINLSPGNDSGISDLFQLKEILKLIGEQNDSSLYTKINQEIIEALNN